MSSGLKIKPFGGRVEDEQGGGGGGGGGGWGLYISICPVNKTRSVHLQCCPAMVSSKWPLPICSEHERSLVTIDPLLIP